MRARRQALDALVRCLRQAPVDGGSGTIAALNWMPLLELANEHLLAPALWGALCEAGHAALLSADTCEYLETLHRLNGRRNRALRKQAIELIGALDNRGIVPALLKGGLALFDGPYADPALRMMRDLDVLVPAAARDDAIAVLEQLGYRVVQRYEAGHHAYGDFARPNDPGCVDLHTELVDPCHVLPASEVWARGQLKEVDGVRYVSPCATDRVLHNLLHAQIHHLGNFYRGELQLQQAHELVGLTRHFGPAVDWSFVQRRLAEHRLTVPLESHLLAARHLLGLEWPLSDPPTFAARSHYLWCRVRFEVRALKWINVLLGNLCGAFAWHRMRALHGASGGPLRWRSRHLLQFLRKRSIGAAITRLLRMH
jgi:hypothetical protein